MSAAVVDDAYPAELLDAAHAYAACGVAVFPLAVTVVDTGRKQVHPIGDWDGASTTDPDTITRWFGDGSPWAGTGLGIDTGKSRIAVVDSDGAAGLTAWRQLREHHQAPATYRSATPGGGQHEVFADPHGATRNTQSVLAEHIDTRGVGGFIIAPPTRDARGTYRWLEGTPEWGQLPAVPQFVVDATQPRTPRQPEHGAHDGTKVREFTADEAGRFVQPWLDRLAAAPDGTINNQLHEAALVMSHFGPEFWPVETGVARLHEALAATVYDGRTWKADATIASAYKAPNWRATLVTKTAAQRGNETFVDEFVDHGPGPAPPGQLAPPAPPSLTVVADDGPPLRLPNLPVEFWQARPGLAHIRQAAHARLCSADVVLHAVLARLAAMVSPELRFDSGRGPASLNYFAATIGPSGAGKSTATRAARHMIAVPLYLTPSPDGTNQPFRDGVPLGSGEGIAESFMGTKEVEIDEKPNGHPITKKVRGRVRSNVFAVADEGEIVTRLGERNGSTLGATIRSAWGGETIGQMNAREETTRIVEADSYSLGLLLGFQPSTVQPLITDSGAGTPQRLAYASAIDPAIPDAPVSSPGPLDLCLNADGWRHTPVTGVMPFPIEVIDQLRRDHLDKARGTVIVAEQDSQVPLLRCKIATLLAVLDARIEVTIEDWELAGAVVEASSGVRDALAAYGQGVEAEEAEKRTQAAVERHVRATAAAGRVPEKVTTYAGRIAERVTAAGRLSRSEAGKTAISGRDRKTYRDAAIDRAIVDGLIKEGADGALYPPAPRSVQ